MFVLLSAADSWAGDVSGALKKWQPVTITFDGPEASETVGQNPFLDYSVHVIFSKGERSIRVPGYFAADGKAAETGAASGNKWRVHFVPDEEGAWNYVASFRWAPNVAIGQVGVPWRPPAMNGDKGAFRVGPADPNASGFYGKGLLRYVGKRYLQFAGSGEYFLKGGADSPENFLAYFEFDGTTPDAQNPEAGKERKGEAAVPKKLHTYAPHAGDWKPGDPTWRGGKGKNIIGALNYLAGKGVNSVYFLTMNVGGDGNDVWPWTSREERLRFDVSKLDQWEIVFTHMDRLGLMLHVVTQETENDQLLDKGELGPERMLYYRELIARFAHHPALVWNLGEENTNTTEQLKAFAKYIHLIDPYGHPIVVHTYPGAYDKVYTPLLAYEFFEGPSLQMGNMGQTHAETLKWVERSAKAGRPWFVSLDEIGPAEVGVKPDADDPAHDQVRKEALWGNLMAGGAGVEWYFGYKFPNNDLNCEDFRSRDKMWDQTRYAVEFFRNHLPFAEMTPNDLLTDATGDYVLAKPGGIYAVYLPAGGPAKLNLEQNSGPFTVRWYNPRAGGELRKGTVDTISGPGSHEIGLPPADPTLDWVALVRK
jgi:hypothetical protein